jgi:hypothetical protein
MGQENYQIFHITKSYTTCFAQEHMPALFNNTMDLFLQSDHIHSQSEHVCLLPIETSMQKVTLYIVKVRDRFV